MHWKRPRIFAASVVLLALVGCATPSTRAFRLAERAQLETELVRGVGFRHVVFRNAAPADDAVLQVYLEGDGTPYLDRDTVAADPSPANPLMLKLMLRENRAAVYVGRPCYFDLATDPECHPVHWTLRRYGPEIIESLASVIRAEMVAHEARAVELIGHSGGGTLAVLLASELSEVTRVITFAGNLDTAAWAAHHGYAPLVGSINPTSVPLPADVAPGSVHFAAGNDQVVPAQLIQAAAAWVGGTVIVLPEYSHTCCWEKVWPELDASETTTGRQSTNAVSSHDGVRAQKPIR